MIALFMPPVVQGSGWLNRTASVSLVAVVRVHDAVAFVGLRGIAEGMAAESGGRGHSHGDAAGGVSCRLLAPSWVVPAATNQDGQLLHSLVRRAPWLLLRQRRHVVGMAELAGLEGEGAARV